MNRIRAFISGFVLAVLVSCSACLTGGGPTGAGPSGPAGALPTGNMGGAPSGGMIPGSTEAPPPGPAAAAAGGGDTMPPRADAGDCMTIGLDGTVHCGPPRREACRVAYVPVPKLKVMAGTGEPLPPIPLVGKTSFDGRFYAEIGSADLSCEDPSCWTWGPVNFGDVLMMRLTRLQTAAPALTFHQDAVATLPEADGANVAVAGVPIQDEDAIEFYATLSEAKPEGYSETLVPLTDEVWTKFGIKCEMGGFRIDTGVTYERRTDVPSAAERFFDVLFK
ncbi:MAG TPA: hypothetical protein VLJ37_02610 [bacterium]|nr:hypothetical protein [bacterium]